MTTNGAPTFDSMAGMVPIYGTAPVYGDDLGKPIHPRPMPSAFQALVDAHDAALQARRDGRGCYTREARDATERAASYVVDLVGPALAEFDSSRIERTVAIDGRFVSRLSTRRRTR